MTPLPTAFRAGPCALLHALSARSLGWLAFLAVAHLPPPLRGQRARRPASRRRRCAPAIAAAGGWWPRRRACGSAPRRRVQLGRRRADRGGAARAGRGIVFLTPHLGCFEIDGQALGERFGADHGAVPAGAQGLAARAGGRRARPPRPAAAPTTLAGVRQMLRALRRGEAGACCPTRCRREGQGVWAPFFGRPAYTMTLPARLAQQTGAAVLLALGERLPGGRGYRVHLRALRRRADRADARGRRGADERRHRAR